MRTKPPYASFFSKVGGKLTKIEGPYEPQWLDVVETYRWEHEQEKKKRKGMFCKIGRFSKAVFDKYMYRQTS